MIGIRRDREGIMPGTLTFPAEVETALIAGDIAQLDSAGELIQGTAGTVATGLSRWLVVANFVSGVTGPAASGTDTYDCIVIPLDDELTYIGPVTELDTGDAEALVPGQVLNLNATGDGFTVSVSVTSTDFRVVKVLETGTATAIVEAVKA